MVRWQGKVWVFYLAAGLLGLAPAIQACGPFITVPVFTFTQRPENFADFAQGHIGIIQPTWRRSVLTVAYRALNGLPLAATEQQAAIRDWQAEFERTDANDPARQAAIKTWLISRKQALADGAQEASVDVYRAGNESYYSVFLNCAADAFANAARTLEKRLASYRAGDAVSAWVKAQDQVFGNCSGGASIPEELAADAPEWLKTDRDYQIAAAHFYATQYDAADARLQKIAQAKDSPWRLTAKYLLARVAIRQGRLEEAENRLNAVLNDAALSSLHASAKRLLNYVAFRSRSRQLHGELAEKLAQPSENANFFQDLTDYRLLLDKAEGYEDADAEAKTLQAQFREQSEMTDWIFTVQSTGADAANHALARWRARKQPAWLVAALAKAPDDADAAAELLAAAQTTAKDSPGYLSVAYHSARLQLAQGHADVAREILDDILGDDRLPINLSTHNQLFALRLRLAQNLDEFVHYAQRQAKDFTAEGECFLEDFSAPAQGEDYLKGLRLWRERSMFDEDAARVLNWHTPLTRLKALALHAVWPDHLKQRLVMSVWVRAVLLEDDALAQEFAPLLAQSLPELKQAMAAYRNGKTRQARHFEAIWLMLNNPGLKPLVETAYGRSNPVGERDSLRDNWWCDSDFGREPFSGKKLPSELPPQTLLTAAELKQADEENNQIADFSGGSNYLAAQAVAWAKADGKDRRLPEALHLAVRATRYGCQNCATGKASKAAFELLQKRFKTSQWRKKTPYWFDGFCAEQQ